MYCDYNAPTRLVNCTFTENTAALGSAGLHDQALQAIVTNCIFWANSTPGGSGYSAEVNTAYSGLVTYCCIEGYFVPELFHNFGDDPLFLDPDGPDDDPATFDDNDYRLSAGSPCIDAGVNWAVAPDAADLDGDGDTAELVPLDLGGSARFADDPLSDDSGCGVPAVVDIGAHEFRGQPFEVRLGDIDGDGSVGILDFLGLLVNWGPCAQECCLADLDLDGQVGIADFRLLVGNWG
jgi:hypothetical protein